MRPRWTSNRLADYKRCSIKKVREEEEEKNEEEEEEEEEKKNKKKKKKETEEEEGGGGNLSLCTWDFPFDFLSK